MGITERGKWLSNLHPWSAYRRFAKKKGGEDRLNPTCRQLFTEISDIAMNTVSNIMSVA